MPTKIFLNLFCFLALVVSSCNFNNPDHQTPLDFNTIEHYSIHLSEVEKKNLMTISRLNETDTVKALDTVFRDLVSGQIILFNQKNLIPELEKMGFQKSIVDTSNFQKISHIFTQKNLKERDSYKCVHHYQDILVLKNNDSIQSVIQICFSCQEIIIKSANPDYNSDINEKDFIQLSNILNKNSE